jgi:lactoylglutathione lyase
MRLCYIRDQRDDGFSLAQEVEMNLGTFSVSLTVKDLQASRDFYEKLGFSKFGGEESQNWLIMKNNNVAIGLFQGMFEDNILTFNPGWDSDANPVDEFTDVRELRRQLEENGIDSVLEAEDEKKGPAYFLIEDPDGNTILFDQHV